MKIEYFGFVDEELNELIVEIGLAKPIFPIVEEDKVKGWQRIHPMSARKHGLFWNCNNKKVIINDGNDIFGYPSVEMDEVIAIYVGGSLKYPLPNNAVIYNADGSLKRVLKPPTLVSDLAKNKLSDIESDMPSTLYFDQVKWAKDQKENLVVAIRIMFAYEFYEVRVLFPKTGEFGECLNSGRL